eukprot:5813000-Alexandrium_andersonii.AAC.1
MLMSTLRRQGIPDDIPVRALQVILPPESLEVMRADGLVQGTGDATVHLPSLVAWMYPAEGSAG